MEKETEAMATDQFSSSNDIFYKLPEHIIHSIFRFLPTIKDVVRTSAISKSCLQAWGTFLISRFDLNDFFSGSSILISREEEVEAKTEQFIRFVDICMQRFGRQIRDGNGFCEHLALRIYMKGTPIKCFIPDSVLSAYWLKSLHLFGSTIYIPLTVGSRVNLPSLTSLCIYGSDIPDEQLQKLLNGCPSLEDINLCDCPLLSKVDILDHPNLESLNVSSVNTRLVALKVRAPKLKSFAYKSDHTYVGDVVKIHNSPELKKLIIREWNMTEESFHKFIAQFPLIEDLTIIWCNELREIRISNPLLQKIIIKDCYDLEDVVISCKMLTSFSVFTPGYAIPYLSIWIEMDNSPNDCTAVIESDCDFLMEASWYCNFNEFLTRAFPFKILNVIVEGESAKDGDMEGEDLHTKLPPAACNIEKLRLNVTAPSSCHSQILNGLLSACHPTVIKLDVTQDSHFVKLVCEEFGNRETNSKCWCKDDFKCWKHQLKEVKIKKIKGIDLEKDMEWDVVFDLLPTLEDGNDIYFKLMW